MIRMTLKIKNKWKNIFKMFICCILVFDIIAVIYISFMFGMYLGAKGYGDSFDINGSDIIKCRLCDNHQYLAGNAIQILFINTCHTQNISVVEYMDDGTFRHAGEYGYMRVNYSGSDANPGTRIEALSFPDYGYDEIKLKFNKFSLRDRHDMERLYCGECIDLICQTTDLYVVIVDNRDFKLYDIAEIILSDITINEYTLQSEVIDGSAKLKITFVPLSDEAKARAKLEDST